MHSSKTMAIKKSVRADLATADCTLHPL